MRILVTAGPTREYLDSVRFLSNASSGKMGYAVAAEASRRGHEVILVVGPVELADLVGVSVVRTVSARNMFDAVMSRFESCQAFVMAAAVCDYRPTERVGRKLKKQDRTLSVEFEPTKDICAHLGRVKGGRLLVGFALEDHDHRRHAEAKLVAKGCDAIVLNRTDVLGSDDAEIEILRADTGWSPPVSGSKRELAGVIVDLIASSAGPER